MKVPWRTVVRDAQVELSEKFSGLYIERNLVVWEESGKDIIWHEDIF